MSRVPLALILAACVAPSTQPEPVSGPGPGPAAGPVSGTLSSSGPWDDEVAAVAAVLDDWHAAASEADGPRYLGHFAPRAVFMGTDATERWTLSEFTGYVRGRFALAGWTYHPHDRFVSFSDDGRVAWFDEALTHGSYGELRGTGVLRKDDGVWRIAHYNLTFTIPNKIATEVVQVVTSHLQAGGGADR